MTFKKSLIEDIKNSAVRREVTFILNDKNSSKKLRREICNLFPLIGRNLNNRLDLIAKITDIIPTKLNVAFTSPTWPIYENDINDVFNQLHNPKNLRVLINFEDFNSEHLDRLMKTESELSHLVEISFIEHSEKDLNSFKSSSSTIYANSPSKVIKVIEDVMLDISMYYSIFDEDAVKNLDFRKNFSYEKVSQIEKTNLNSNDWDIKRNKGYVALAGYFWDSNNFDYINYIELWKKIGKDLGINNNKIKFPDIKKQLKLHKDFGELPLAAIEKTFNKLENGEYLLARLIKIPKKHKAQLSLLSIFGGSIIKRGKWKIIKKENAIVFDNYISNVSLFKIIKR